MPEIIQSRRSFVRGLGALFVAAPAIVRASSLMAIRGIPMQYGASAAVKIMGGAIISVTLTHSGSGYTLLPMFTIKPEWLDLPVAKIVHA